MKTLIFIHRFILLLLVLSSTELFAQLSVSGCPSIEKRNNGNGKASSAAGRFPGYGQDNTVAANVNNTPYQTVTYDPQAKTGNINFYWSSAIPIANIPVITRVWITPVGSSTAVPSAVTFGPPPPPVVIGQNYYVSYSFYAQNIPPQGKITLEFADPQNGQAAFYCTYDLQNNSNSTTPTFDCSPVITTQPSNVNVCGNTSASFTVAARGATAYQWQTSANGTTGWSNITNGGNYSGATSATLMISNPSTYDGKYFRAVITGNNSCGTSSSNAALLIAKPLPTAVFSTTSYCGTGNRSIAVNLTGTAPWSITYSTTPSTGSPSATTVSNISTSAYYFSVSPSLATTYTITAVSDAYCSNSGPTGNIATVVNLPPTVTPVNASVCYGTISVPVSYSATGSPNQYSITAGTRSMPGFSAISNATLGSTPFSFTIPSSIAAGTYDFNLVVRNSATGCSSSVVPFTVTINAAPSMNATAGAGTVCAASTATLTASPSNLTSYSWTISPSATVIATGVSPTVTVNATTTYTVTGTNSNGCTSTANVTVTAVSGPTLTINPSAPTICSGSATILSASGGNTYSWSPSTGLSATSGNNVVASPTTTTTYTVTSSNVTGCQSVGTVTVTVSSPSVSVTSSATICSGTIKTLTAAGASTYSWYPTTGLYTNAGATTPYTGTTTATVYAKPTSSTTYYVAGTTAAGCESIASSTVTISPAPVNSDSSSGNSFIFCTQGTSSFPLNVKMNATVDSAVWSYSTSGASYTSFRSAVTVSSTTLTPSSTGTNPAKKYTCTLSGYGSSAYGGPRYFRLTIYSPTCNYNYDIYVTDTKGTNPTPPVAAGQTSICNGNSILMNVGSLATGTTAQWQSSPDSSTWTNVAGATANFTATPSSTTYYRVQYNGGNGNCGSYSGGIKITVITSLPANTVTPAVNCTDGSSTITLTGTSISGGIYQWQKSTTSSTSGFSNILGGTQQDYTLPTNIVPVTTWYRRIASTGICATDSSVAVAVYPPISTNQITNSAVSYCGTATATALTASTPTGGSGTYTYQWQSSVNGTTFSNISGATSANYTTVSTSATTYYQRIVYSGGCTNTSGMFAVTVNANPTVTVTAGSTVCSGTSVSLTAAGASTYSWSPSTELSAVTGPTVTSNPTATRTYTITGTSSNGCTGTATTTLNVNALPSTPTLSSSSQTICSGSSISLASKVTSGGTVQWYTAPVANASYLVATPSSVSASGTYYAFALSGSCYSSAYATFTLAVSDVTAPSVASASLRYCAPATADLTALQPVAASGTTLEWHTASSSPGGGNLVSTPTSVSSGTYYLYVYSTGGTCFGTASSAVTVTIDPVVTATVSSTSVSACSPSTINLNSYNSTAGTNTYGWYTSATPSPAALVQFPTQISQSGAYYLFATTAQGCMGPASSAVNVTINPLPATTITSPDAACGNLSRTISGTTDAFSPTYQWQISSNTGTSWSNLTNTGRYSGSTTSSLSINPTNGLGGNYYRYTVTSSTGCSATSNPAIMVEEASPSISSNPANKVAYTGNTTTFSVVETSATADYLWQMSTNNGSTFNTLAESSTFAGVNSPTLTVRNINVSQDNYLFKVIISNNCSTVSSTAARLNVSDVLPVSWLSFSAVQQASNVELTWATASEANSKDFLIKRSADGITWEAIGQVNASGYSNSRKDYVFMDEHPLTGFNYYQLLQRDFDGRERLSKIISVEFAGNTQKLKAFPVPVTNGVLNVQSGVATELSVFTSLGEQVISTALQEGVQQIDVSMLPKGIYFGRTATEKITIVIQ